MPNRGDSACATWTTSGRARPHCWKPGWTCGTTRRDPACAFVPRVEEFSALIEDASRRADCAVLPADEFDCIVADAPLEFRRKTLGLKPAVWYGLFTGGVRGAIDVFDRDRVRISPVGR